MDKRLFRQDDEVTLVSGEFIDQLEYWKDNKALVSRNQYQDEDYIYIKSGNGYRNGYLAEDLRLIKKGKTIINKNKDFIKKHSKKKNFITTYLIQNFILITKDNNKQ